MSITTLRQFQTLLKTGEVDQVRQLALAQVQKLPDDPDAYVALARCAELADATAVTGAWQEVSLRLVGDMVGRKVKLEFRVITDPFNPLEGWFIDDVKVVAN